MARARVRVRVRVRVRDRVRGRVREVTLGSLKLATASTMALA